MSTTDREKFGSERYAGAISKWPLSESRRARYHPERPDLSGAPVPVGPARIGSRLVLEGSIVAGGGSTRVVVLALVANAGIAVAKFIGAVVTGSGSMMAESVHSVADSGNQALLLLGGARAKKPEDASHPLGYGRESYFWALLVSVILFVLGGAFSLYEGIHKLQGGEPLTDVGWAVGILLIGCLLE
ncbi:MAG: cation transporter, partial [Rhodothermaceae bacterium]|nr:cation transporter [Rhodothermaceae bacterium]